MLQEHLSASLWDLVSRFADWVERLPRWLQSAVFGAGLIFAFMVWRGGLIAIPITFLYLLLTDPALLIHKVIPVMLIYAPGAGFLGGLLYGITQPGLRYLGKAGKLLQFIIGTWAYCVVLIFLIMPIIDPKEAASTSTKENWIVSGGMGLVFGLALGIGAMSADRPPNPAASRRFVIGAVIVGAVLLLAMKIAGWW